MTTLVDKEFIAATCLAPSDPTEGLFADYDFEEDFEGGVSGALLVRGHSTQLCPTHHRLTNKFSRNFRRPDLCGWLEVEGGHSAGKGIAIGKAVRSYTFAVDHSTRPSDIVFALINSERDPLAGYEQYAQEDWDSAGARPITVATLRYARKLIKDIPTIFGSPDIAPSASGFIGLEWVLEAGSLRKLFFDIGPGEEWWAYWLWRDGKFGRLSGKSYSRHTPDQFRELFNELSK